MKIESELYTVLTKYTTLTGVEVVKAYGIFNDKPNCQTVKRQIIKDGEALGITATMVTIFPATERPRA